MGEPVDVEKMAEQAEHEAEVSRDRILDAREEWERKFADYSPRVAIENLMLEISRSPDPGGEAWIEELDKLFQWIENNAEDLNYPDRVREDQFRDDAEADADTLRSAGFGTDEDYGGGDERL